LQQRTFKKDDTSNGLVIRSQFMSFEYNFLAKLPDWRCLQSLAIEM